jgi:hypothetical protein
MGDGDAAFRRLRYVDLIEGIATDAHPPEVRSRFEDFGEHEVRLDDEEIELLTVEPSAQNIRVLECVGVEPAFEDGVDPMA